MSQSYICETITESQTNKVVESYEELVSKLENTKRFTCDFHGCNKSFARAGRLDMHRRTVHLGEGLHICDYDGCGKTFAEKGNLLVHLRTHTGDKPFKCQHCEMRFTSVGNCRDHERRHNNEK